MGKNDCQIIESLEVGMFWVLSRWKALPGKEAEWRERGVKVRDAMRRMPGVELVDSFETESGEVVAMVGYTSEADYDRITRDPNGPFEKAVAEHRLEEVANWVSSERGTSLDG